MKINLEICMNYPEKYLVWKEGSTNSTPSYIHSTYQSALKEAERLAIEVGGKFHVFTQSATVERNLVKVTEYHEQPF